MMKNKWIGYTVLFVIIIVILLAIISWKPLMGVTLTIITILTLFVASVLEAYCKKDLNDGNLKQEDNVEPLTFKTLKNSKNLLRYATVLLGFLSLTTTANGMKKFVFEEDWQAYVGSFAVQSILIVFSLLLCRFFVKVSQLSWDKYVKRLVNGLMVLFFCICLVVSSIFSFSYIANSAYEKSWISDSEIIIQNHLLEVSYALKEENDFRGKQILESLNSSSKEQLKETMDVIVKQEQENLKNKIYGKLQTIEFSVFDETAVDINKEVMLSSHPQYLEDAEMLWFQYETSYKREYVESLTQYNKVKDTIDSWKTEEITYQEILSYAENTGSKIDSEITKLTNASNSIENWKTYGLKEDISSYREHYRLCVRELILEYEQIQIFLQEVTTLVNEYENSLKGNGTQDVTMEGILVDIYALEINSEKNIDDIVEDISTLLVSVSGNKDIDDENIQSLISLKNDLVLYREYLDLKNNLEAYIQNNIRSTYKIIEDDADKPEQENDNTANVECDDNKEVIYEVTEMEWKDIRNNDFYDFYTYLKSLPDTSILSDVIEQEEHYDMNGILEETTEIQRDLLGELTDFEKAFIYFKYRFPVMACFSAFIAVFFDLGAFFTGCFLYATEYFYIKKEDVDLQDKG